MEKNKLVKFEHIVLLSYVQFWIVVQGNFYKGRRKEKREKKKKEKKKEKIAKLRPSSLVFFSFLIPEIEPEKKSKENK